MKIGIVGGGSIGLLFAAYLHRLFKVTLYTRTERQADEINRDGIRLLNGIGPLRAAVRAQVLGSGVMENDLTIVAVKQYQLESLIGDLPDTGGFLFLQNGMGHLKLLEKMKAETIYVGSVEHGASRETSTSVSHNGMGVTRVAVFRGNPDLLKKVSDALSEKFPFHIEPDYYEMLSGKLAANAVINPLTAILGVKNGELVQNSHFESLLETLFKEVAGILDFKDHHSVLLKVKGICKNTAENKSSMLKDLDSGRQTEVDAIIGYLLEQAKSKGMEAPLLNAYYEIIKGRELAGGVKG
ncbi:2-dehydropantoate 2-reductase [Bacillus sp. FJAT-27445]|uniref:2-dehydropantoate 2-reductase n=1 Tax=Bacillus sp. FJAT-27445 TaxID=1679166 RepID=UPI00074351FC|nr:2-dehydropantoate 2-reductase [Bacillus sp. FJAT-27445]